MSKRPMLLGVLAALMMGQVPVVAIASATNDAERAVLDGRSISMAQLRSYGQQYVTEFINAYHYGTITYRQAYQAGATDCRQQSVYRPPQSRVGAIGYQRGWQQMQSLHDQSGSPTNQPSNHSSSPQNPADSTDQQATNQVDDRQYPVRAPERKQAQFIRRLAKLAQRLGKQYDLYPSIVIAQAALEIDWGSSNLSRPPCHNLFGVKDNGRGDTVLAPTSEYFAGSQQQVRARFRTYDSDWSSLLDYGETLQDPLYHGVHRSTCTHYRQATCALLGKYATDPEYDQKLNQLIDQYQLTRYDQPLREADHGKPHSVHASFHDFSTSMGRERHQTRAKHHYPTPIVSVMGGAGTAGLFQLLRRFCFK